MRKYAASIVLLVIASGASAQGGAREMLAQGNQAANAGDWSRAAEIYASVETMDEGALAPEAAYNRARALHALDQLDAATGAYRQAARAASERPDLASRAMFNLGDIGATKAEGLAPQDPSAAIAQYKEAASLYRAAYRLNPSDADAARNLEAVNRRIHELKEQIQRQKEMQEQLQELANDLQDLNERHQQDQADRDEQQQGQEAEESAQPDEQGERQQASETPEDEIAQDAVRAAQKSEELADRFERQAQDRGSPTGQSPAADALRQAAQELRESAQQRREAEQAERDGREHEAQQRRERSGAQSAQAERIVQQLLEQAKQEQSDSQEQRQQQQQGETEGEPQEPEQQARREDGTERESSAFDQSNQQRSLAERLLDREKRQREQRERAREMQRGRAPDVERDW